MNQDSKNAIVAVVAYTIFCTALVYGHRKAQQYLVKHFKTTETTVSQ